MPFIGLSVLTLAVGFSVRVLLAPADRPSAATDFDRQLEEPRGPVPSRRG